MFVSTPEKLQDNTKVMLWIQQLCIKQPWRFKQGFDWATSGNKYDSWNSVGGVESGGVELYDAKVDAAKWGAVFKGDPSPVARWKQLVGEGELECAHACVRDDIAPHIVATEWYKHVPGGSVTQYLSYGAGQHNLPCMVIQ